MAQLDIYILTSFCINLSLSEVTHLFDYSPSLIFHFIYQFLNDQCIYLRYFEWQPPHLHNEAEMYKEMQKKKRKEKKQTINKN